MDWRLCRLFLLLNVNGNQLLHHLLEFRFESLYGLLGTAYTFLGPTYPIGSPNRDFLIFINNIIWRHMAVRYNKIVWFHCYSISTSSFKSNELNRSACYRINSCSFWNSNIYTRMIVRSARSRRSSRTKFRSNCMIAGEQARKSHY